MLVDTYMKNSLLPKRYLPEIPLTPSKTDKPAFLKLAEIKDNIKTFVDNGENLYICSVNVGNGKTTWATKLLKSYINSVAKNSFANQTPALYININNFLNDKKLAIKDAAMSLKVQEIEKNILSAKLVIFDDIADKTLSEYDISNMYYWVDYRTSNMLSTIYTSNMLPEMLDTCMTSKLASRIVNYSKIVEFKDGDHRTC